MRKPASSPNDGAPRSAAQVYTSRDACRFLGVLLATRRLSSTPCALTDARCLRIMYGCWKQEEWKTYFVCIIVGGAMADGPSVIECQLWFMCVRYNVRVLRLKGLVLFVNCAELCVWSASSSARATHCVTRTVWSPICQLPASARPSWSPKLWVPGRHPPYFHTYNSKNVTRFSVPTFQIEMLCLEE